MRRFLLVLILALLPLFCWSSGVKLVPNGGVFEQSFYVKMEAEGHSAIYYTTDGTAPGTGSSIYKDSILITDVTVLRAVTFIDGKRSDINTQSYFLGRTYTLPIVSVVSDPNNFWSYDKGIYEKGCCADSTMPYYNANFWKSWEYECNVEMYTPSGKNCINQLAGMSLFGGYSRMLPQKSLAIIARSKYGKNRFAYPIFKERKNKNYKSFIIRNSGGDFKRTQLRDAFMTQLAKPTGIAIQAYEPAIIYLNGKYWGIQNLREKISEHYLKDNFKVDKNNVDILRHNGVKRHGYSKDYKFLLRFLRTNDLSDNSIADSLSKFMDIHDYISYNIAEVYSDNKDAGGNIRYFKERELGKKWRWIFYDLDMGLANDNKKGYASNTLKTFTTPSNEKWPNPSWSTFIIRTLLKNKKFEQQYINTFCDYLNTCFHSDTAVALLNRMAKKIEAEIPFHQKRWGSTLESWEKNINIVKEFIKKRPVYLFQHLDQKFGLDTLISVSVNIPDDNTCKIKLNSLNLDRDFTGKYFTNIPQKISVKPKHDYKLIGWKGRPETTEIIEFEPSKDIFFEPIIVPKDSSQFKNKIIFNEINFKQIEKDSSKDWIELYNNTDQSIDIKGWLITDKSYKKGHKIKGGVIKPKGYLILAERSNLIAEMKFLDKDLVNGNINFGLSQKGEFLKLYDEQGLLVDYIVYNVDHHLTIDTAFSLALSSPDSSRTKSDQWLIQKPTPLMPNPSYTRALLDEEIAIKKRKNLRIFSAIFGSILLVLIFLFLRHRKK